MATALDKEILDKARQDNFIVVTLDSYSLTQNTPHHIKDP